MEQASLGGGIVSWFQSKIVHLLIASFFLVRASQAQTLTDLGATTTPTRGFHDISQLIVSGQANMPDGLNYYTDNQSNHGNGEPGQTFTTPRRLGWISA